MASKNKMFIFVICLLQPLLMINLIYKMEKEENKLKNKRLKIFLEFLIFGVVFGFVENLIAIYFATVNTIDVRSIVISILVVIPFAAIGELVVDKIQLIPKTANKLLKHFEIFFEFLVFGVIMGIIEDLIVIGILTGEPITLKMVLIVALVTTPFAVFGEIVVDRCDWLSWIKKKIKLAGFFSPK